MSFCQIFSFRMCQVAKGVVDDLGIALLEEKSAEDGRRYSVDEERDCLERCAIR